MYHSRRPTQTFEKDASLVYEPGATKLSFFFNSGPKKLLSLSLNVKCDQQTHKKIMPPNSNHGINLKKSSNKVPIMIFQMLLAGRETHKNRLFYGFKGVFMGSIIGSQNIMGLDYGSNISVYTGREDDSSGIVLRAKGYTLFWPSLVGMFARPSSPRNNSEY
jgi:hypothetical protein